MSEISETNPTPENQFCLEASFSHLEIPQDYKLIVGLSLGYPSDNPVNTFNVGRDDLDLGF